MISRIIRNSLCILLSLYVALWPVSSISQTATLLPNGMQQFFDNNGNPLSSGIVDFYIPSTTTRKNTWQDAAETIVNTNPVLLDGAGRALIYGDGSYRQVLKDSSLNLIWDKVVSSYANGTTIITTGDGDQVGTIKPWAGILAPNQYAFANGQEILRTTFAALFTAITQTLSVACTNGSSIITGVSDTTQIPFGAKVELSCVPPGTTVTNKTLTTVTLSAPSNVTLNTTATFFAFGNGNGTTTFNLPDLRGYVVAGRPNMGGTASTNLTAAFFGNTPNAIGATGGNQSRTLITANLPAYTPSGSVALGFNDPGHFHTTTAVPSNPGLAAGGAAQFSGGAASAINSDVKTTGITFSPSFTGVAQGGTSTAFAGIQPTMTLNYIIKVTPDTSAQQASGVASLGGMIGAVACGTGVICTGNTIGLAGNTTIGPSVSVVNNLPVFGNTTGSILLDSGGSGASVPRLWQPVNTNCDSGHSIFWIDQNSCEAWGVKLINNDDPSVLVQIPIAGTPGPTNATQTLTFTFAGACVAGCNATYTFQAFNMTSSISGTNLIVTSLPGGNTIQIGQAITGAGVSGGTIVTGPIPGTTWSGGIGTYTINNSQIVASETMTATDTLASISWGLSNAIKTNANLYNPNAVITSDQKEIIWSTANTPSSPAVSLDIDGRTSLKITTSNTGGSTTTSIPPVSCGTACVLNLDVGTFVDFHRALPFVPVSGSNIAQLFFSGPKSGGSGVYGQITTNIVNPATSLGAIFLSGQWSSGISSGIWVSQGLYSLNLSDMGVDAANFASYYINGNSGLQLSQPGGAGTDVKIINHAAASLILGTSNTSRLTILSGGTTFLNLNGTNVTLDSATSFATTQIDGNANQVELQAYGAGTLFTGKRNNNTNSSPTTLTVNNLITSLAAEGYDGTAFTAPAAQVQLLAGGTWSNTSHPAKIDFYVTPAASTTIALAMEIDTNGAIILGNPTGGNKGTSTINSQGQIFVNNSAVGVLGQTNAWTGSNSFVTSTLGIASATNLTVANGVSNGLILTAPSGSNGSVAMATAIIFTLGSTTDSFAVNDHLNNTILFVNEATPGTIASSVLTFSGTNQSTTTNSGSIQTLGGIGVAKDIVSGGSLYTSTATFMNRSKIAFTNNAAAAAGTLTNAPTAGNPTKWIAIDDNGTTRFIPAW